MTGRALVSLDQMEALGRSLGRSLAPGEVIWLEGELGAGKTTMVQAIVRGLDGTGEATSPTYNLVHRYPAPAGPVYHVDCYRLRAPDEAEAIDWEDLAAGAALLVEWPERAGPWAVPPTRRIALAHADRPDRRWIEIR